MFKLLSRGLPKSNRSLTKYSNIYKKILSACHINTSQQQKNGPKTHARNTGDNSQRSAKKFEVTYKTSRTFSSSCVGKTGLKFLKKKSLFPQKCNGKVKLVMFSTSSSTYFYSSTMNQTKNNNKKYFKNQRALELYKKAFEQCMKIKFEKHRIDRANNKIGWTPEPLKITYPQELVVISDKKKTKDTFKLKKKSVKHVLKPIPKKSYTVKEMAQKRKALEQKMLTSNRNKKKMKIVYPSHTIKHNLGLSTSYRVDKSIRKKIELLSDVENKRSKKLKPKAKANTIEVIPIKQKLNQNLLKVITAISKRREKICEENAPTDDAIKYLISQHPIVKKATKAAKMSMNKKYNVILLKSQAKVQLKMLKPEEFNEENVTIEGLPAEELKKASPTETNEIVVDKMSESPILIENQPGTGPKITQHPTLPSKFQKYPWTTVKYPKSILVDKTNNFDIDGICLRTKEKHEAYVDEFDETLTKVPSYSEITNTNLQKEQEKTTPEYRKTPNLNQVKAQDNVWTKDKPDNNGATTNENLIKDRPTQDKKQNPDARKYVSQPEIRMKTVSPSQSLQHYLKRLNELKDQTSVDRLSAANYPNRMSKMVENLDLKKINNDKKNKISGETVDVKENGTDNQNTERRDNRNITENVIKLEDSKGTDENIRQKIKDDMIVENKIKRSMDTLNATQKDTIEKTEGMTCPKSEKTGMEETNEIHPREVEPYYENLLERNREQVSANERNKSKLKLDQEAIVSKVKPFTEPTSIKPSSARKTSKYSLENYQPITEIMTTERNKDEKGQTTVSHKENVIFKKILQQYTVMSKTATDIEKKQAVQDKQTKESDREKVVSENKTNLKNYSDHSVNVYGSKTPQDELKIHSIAVEKHNYSGNDLTSSTHTSSKNNKFTVTKDVRKDYNTPESKYTEKLKNLLEPANEYLEKLREAGENQMKSLGELKTQFKQLIENTSKINENLKRDIVTKIPDGSGELNQEMDLRKNRLIEVHKNQLTSNVDSRTNLLEILPNEKMDHINLRKEKNISDQKHKYGLEAYQNIEAKDAIKSTKPSENSKEEYGIQKMSVESKKPLKKHHSFDKSSDKLTTKNEERVKPTKHHLSEVKRDPIVEGIDLPRKEYISEDSNKIFDKDLRDTDSAVEETFFYILKEKEDFKTDIVETKNRVADENVPKIVEEKLSHVIHSTRKLPDLPEGFTSKQHIGDHTNHKNLLQNKETNSSQYGLESSEKTLPSQKSPVIEQSLSSNHSTNVNHSENNQPLIRDEVFSQPTRSTETLQSENEEKIVLLRLDKSDGDQIIEPSSEKNRKLSYIHDSSQNFVLLHNRPTIRKDNPPTNNPKTDINKKDKPKTKKDLVLPPRKSSDTSKMTEGTFLVEDEKLGNVLDDESIGKQNNMEKSKYIIENQYRSLESENRSENLLHDYIDKVDLEDTVFSYRKKPRYDPNKLLKNWINILAFIEELKITYKDGSDANLIKMSKELDFLEKKSDREGLEYAKVIPVNTNEQKQTSSRHNEITKKIDFNENEKYQTVGKAIVENTSVDDSVFSNSRVKTEKPASLNNNEINQSKQLFSNTKIDETCEDHQKQDIRTESTILSKYPLATKVPKFPKTNKWPPKTMKFKFPSSGKKCQRNSIKKSSNEVSESKLSKKKVWRHQERPGLSSRTNEKPESSKVGVHSKLELFKKESGSAEPSVSNFLEDNLKNWKSMNKKSEGLFFRKNASDSLNKTNSLIYETESALLKSFLLDEDEEINVAKSYPKPNENSGKSSPKTKEYLNKYSEEKGTSHHSDNGVEKTGEVISSFKESTSSSVKLRVDDSPNTSKSEGSKVTDKMVHSNLMLPRKHTKPKQRTLSNSLEENIKIRKLLKTNMPETSNEGVDKTNTLKCSRLPKMISSGGNEYPENSKQLKREHTTIIPELRKHLYENQQKLRKEEYENLKTTSRQDEKMYNEKVESLSDSSTAEKKVKTRSTALSKIQEDRRYQEIHSKKTNQDHEKYRTGCNSSEELNNTKEMIDLVPSRLRKSITETEFSSKSNRLKKYSLDKSNYGKNTEELKKTEPLIKSIEDLHKMEKTNNCFSLCFRKAGHLNRPGVKKEDDRTNAKKVKKNLSKCLVTFTLPKMNSEKLKQSSTDSKEPVRVSLKQLLVVRNSDNYPNLKNVRRIDCSSPPSSINGRYQKGRSEQSFHDFDGNGGDGNRTKGAPKLIMKVLLPKNRYILGDKAKSNGIQLQEKEPDAQKDGKVPGKLKKRAIFKLGRNFGLMGKYGLSENRLDNILKVSTVSYDRNTYRNTPQSAKHNASLKITKEKQINLKDNTLRKIYSTVHLNRIMDKYRMNTDKLQDVNDLNVVLTEVELFERRRSKERLLEAFNKKIKNKSKVVHSKVEKVTMERILRKIKSQNKLNFRSQKAEKVKIISTSNTLNENKNSTEKVNAKKKLHGVMTTGKTRTRSKINTLPSKNSTKHEKRQTIEAKYGNYCFQNQLKRMNKKKPTKENEMNNKRQTSNNTNYKSETKVLGKDAENLSNNYSECPMSSQRSDFIIIEKNNDKIHPVSSTEQVSVNTPSPTNFLLEKQIFGYRISPTPNEQFNNVTEMKNTEEQKSGSGMADNGKMADIDQQRLLKMKLEIPKSGTKLPNKNEQRNPASNTEKVSGDHENNTSMELSPKGNNSRYTKFVVEKKLPVYPLIEVKAPKQAVTKFCYQLQIPPKTIMQVLLTQPRSDVTTLTENPRKEIMLVPKKSNPKSRNLKITYIRVNRKPENFDESFLPALTPNKEGNKTRNKNVDFQMNKEQILKLRYQLLKQLREEFEILNDKQIDRMLQSGTEKNDKSEFKFKLTENRAIGDEKSPKNNTEMLIKKLSEKDRSEKKGEPEKPDGDPKKK